MTEPHMRIDYDPDIDFHDPNIGLEEDMNHAHANLDAILDDPSASIAEIVAAAEIVAVAEDACYPGTIQGRAEAKNEAEQDARFEAQLAPASSASPDGADLWNPHQVPAVQAAWDAYTAAYERAEHQLDASHEAGTPDAEPTGRAADVARDAAYSFYSGVWDAAWNARHPQAGPDAGPEPEAEADA
jgi:hypothetical protein